MAMYDDERIRKYEDDERTLTMAEIEDILVSCYGESEYDREAGCYAGGRNWLSIENILSELSNNC